MHPFRHHHWLALATIACQAVFLATATASTSVDADREDFKTQFDTPVPISRLTGSDEIVAYRILCIGDSITRHGTNDNIRQRLGWAHVSGMAASSEENDYAHRLARLVQQTLPDRRVELHFHTAGGSGKASQRLAAINTVLPLKPHLVIVQLGEHEKEADGIEALQNSYEQLVTAFDLQTPHRPLVIATGTWSLSKQVSNPNVRDDWRYTGWPATVDRVMRNVCQKHDIPFVPVNDLARDPANRGWGTSPGVKWHPNDNGHAGYAQKIFSAWQAATASSRHQ